MPKKKTGQRKKAEKQKQRQATFIRAPKEDIAKLPCNAEMVCDKCERRQKNRAFCYFCGSLQRLPMCGHCGRTKCLNQTGECVVKHPGGTSCSVTGMQFVGCICDFCEAWVCHNRKCIKMHSCPCPLDGAVCVECTRGVWEHGGRVWKCGTCRAWLCEDDQFEHQASCQIVLGETYKCYACNKAPLYACLRCKICFCYEHVAGKIKRAVAAGSEAAVGAVAVGRKGEAIACKKCGFAVADTSSLSLSAKSHEYGRHSSSGGGDDEDGEGGYGDEDDEGGYGGGAGYSYGDGEDGGFQFGGYGDDDEEDEYGEDEDGEEDGEEGEEDDDEDEDGAEKKEGDDEEGEEEKKEEGDKEEKDTDKKEEKEEEEDKEEKSEEEDEDDEEEEEEEK